ncbi:HNH endonuclease signature motif containing protein [Paractinoplanes durhamensis]|nr:HNH endonuclease signature motif containing protein [Actinoplanes durhamensis]
MLDRLTRSRTALAECADASVWALSDADLLASLEQAWIGVQQLTGVAARLIRQAEVRGLPRAEAASSTVVWLRQRLHTSPAEAQRLVRLAEVLDASPALDAAVAAGTVSAEQARVIGSAIADLPDEAGIDLTAQAETALIGYASEFDPITLSRLGTRILAHVDPEAADRHDEALLKRQEERARRGRGFTMSPFGDGRVRLSGWLDSSGAATVTAALEPLCRPSQDAATDTDLARTPTQRRADALVDVCARVLRNDGQPTGGGESTHMVVTVPITTLQTTPGAPTESHPQQDHPQPDRPQPDRPQSDRPPVAPGPRTGHRPPSRGPGADRSHSAPTRSTPTRNTPTRNTPARAAAAGTAPADSRPADRKRSRDSGSGMLDNGTPISPAEARLLACDARIIPAVLGTAGQVLDVGRARRLFTGPIRRALILRDRGCCFPGCDRPPSWSEAHHIIPWADGGATALSNACLLCRHHHRAIHNTDWQVRLNPDGHPEFLPPPTLDPQRRPRRNAYHLRR